MVCQSTLLLASLPVASCHQEVVRGAIDGFASAFSTHVKSNDKANLAKSPEKRVKARAASKVTGQAAVRLLDAFKASLGDLLPVPFPDCNMELSHIGAQSGAIIAASEKGWSGSMRFSIGGTKTMVCLAASTMHGFAGHVSPSTFWELLLKADKTSYEEDLVKSLYAGTIGPFDAVFLPCGWLFAESVMEDGDLLGLACRGVSPLNNESYNELQLVRKLLTAHNRSDEELEVAVKHIGNMVRNPTPNNTNGNEEKEPESLSKSKEEDATAIADAQQHDVKTEQQVPVQVVHDNVEKKEEEGKVGDGHGDSGKAEISER